MLTASIVTYHTSGDELRDALQRLQASCAERVYVVDNGREPRIAQICREFTKATYIPADNRGYGASHNIALCEAEKAGATLHLVLNSDIEFDPADLAKAAGYMQLNPEVAALHPRIFGLDGVDQYTVRMLPTPFDLILRRFLPAGLAPRSRDRYLLKHLDHAKPFEISYMQGSFMLLRMAALSQVGRFDERYFMYPEDIDLSRRLAAAGKVLYYPEIQVVHAHRQASYRSMKMLGIHIINIIRYFNKWGWLVDPYRKADNRRLRNLM